MTGKRISSVRPVGSRPRPMTIKVYTTPTCPWCAQAKAFLRSRGSAYEEIDVTKDPRLVRELEDLSGQLGVPVITDGRRVVIGFDKAALEKLVAEHAG